MNSDSLLLLQHIKTHISLSDVETEEFLSLVRHRSIEKGANILTQGQRCMNIYFVESGSLRAYHINNEGKDCTIMFAIRDWWITDMSSFSSQTSALLTIQALEPCELIEIDFFTLEKLYQRLPSFEKFFRVLFQNAYIREQLRALQSISLPTKERYLNFVHTYPSISEKITQKQIASYLGVTPEFLSTIKKEK